MSASPLAPRRVVDSSVAILPWALSAWIAGVFLWYLQYKFTAHPGSTYLFTIITDWLGLHGYEAAMRIGTGSLELVASILLFIRRTQVAGAALAAVIMIGAIFFHTVSPLGIDPYHDGGVLFEQAVSVLSSSLIILAIRHIEVRALFTRLTGARA